MPSYGRRETVMLEKAVRGGRNIYGEVIGIMMLDRKFARIPGDMGNATTFDFPVRLHVVRGVDLSVRYRIFRGDEALAEPFIRAATELEQMGVRAITTNCGFLVLFQDVLADAVSIPVFTSSLLQIPLIYRMLRKGQKIGVITANATSEGLGKKHLDAAGARDIPVVIAGMEESEGFKAIAEDREILYPELLRDDMVGVAKKLVEGNPDIGALVFECANLPPYGKFVQDAVSLPVFDFMTLTNMVYSAVVKKEFGGLL
jgi:hypothetical protein